MHAQLGPDWLTFQASEKEGGIINIRKNANCQIWTSYNPGEAKGEEEQGLISPRKEVSLTFWQQVEGTVAHSQERVQIWIWMPAHYVAP